MFIAIIGTRSSGKSTVETYLVRNKGFSAARLVDPSAEPSINDELLRQTQKRLTLSGEDEHGKNLFLAASGRISFLAMSTPVSSSFGFSNGDTRREEPLWFASPQQLLQHVTQNWRSNFVTVDLNSADLLQPFMIRPFFMLIGIDSPLTTRHRRAQETYLHAPSLEEFVQDHDSFYYGANSGQTGSSSRSYSSISRLAHLHIINASDSIPRFYQELDALNLLDQERLRPGWDTYFMQLATLASQRSNCMKRRVGAILVRNKRIVATGYNGTPRGLTNCNEGGCARCNSASEIPDECVCLHAEENALLEAGRERVGDGAVLYCNTCPCLKCTIKIIQTGVKEVVYNLSYKVDDASATLFREAGVTIRRHASPN